MHLLIANTIVIWDPAWKRMLACEAVISLDHPSLGGFNAVTLSAPDK